MSRPLGSLKSRALACLSRREYSRSELARKLAAAEGAAESAELDTVLDELERDGWLSDQRFAHSVVRRRAERFGASRVVAELKRHALDAELIESVYAQLRVTEQERAKAVWQRKFGSLPQTATERAKQVRFLAMRGFSQAVIGKVLRQKMWGEDEVADG